jgi:hypothetical protein
MKNAFGHHLSLETAQGLLQTLPGKQLDFRHWPPFYNPSFYFSDPDPQSINGVPFGFGPGDQTQ